MADTAPYVQTITAEVNPTAIDADVVSAAIRVPFDGTVTAVSYIPNATITGAATNNRAIKVINKKQDGAGTTDVTATLTFANGTNATGYDEKALTLHATPANLAVAVGDVLAFSSVHNGTGLVDPGGVVCVTVSR